MLASKAKIWSFSRRIQLVSSPSKLARSKVSLTPSSFPDGIYHADEVSVN